MADGTLETLRNIVSKFPHGITLAFAYGSGVLKQQGNISPDNMIDFVFVVDDSYQWHGDNLDLHPSHYSFLGKIGVNTVVSVQDRVGAGVYYNTLVPFEGRMIKYGVMSSSNFLRDMNSWTWLYISGRLHKPVQIITRANGSSLRRAFTKNLESAMNTALLCLPGEFSEEELFLTIAGLSYAGDFRMVVGEDKGKIQKIVNSNLDGFRELYHPIIAKDTDVYLQDSRKVIQQNIKKDRTSSLLKSLPNTLLQYVLKSANVPSKSMDDSIADDMSKDRAQCSKLVHQGVSRIVLQSSVTQSAKGILTAGLLKTCTYSAQKVQKMLRGMIK